MPERIALEGVGGGRLKHTHAQGLSQAQEFLIKESAIDDVPLALGIVSELKTVLPAKMDAVNRPCVNVLQDGERADGVEQSWYTGAKRFAHVFAWKTASFDERYGESELSEADGEGAS